MLYHFCTPRTRDWEKYLKKLINFLNKKDETAHLSAFVTKCQATRVTLVKILNECASESGACGRPGDLIQILDVYLPLLEQLIQGMDANNLAGGLQGHLDIVWTSFLSTNINNKSLSHSLRWERCNCYLVLGIAYYQQAVNLHHMNRQDSQAQRELQQNAAAADAAAFDPVFDYVEDTNDSNANASVIFDDKSTIKEISRLLKQSASIWLYVYNSCYPVEINDANFDVIPETFSHIACVLSKMALINAQEFMVQLSVQTGKSFNLTAKLSMGISDKFRACQKLLDTNLSAQSRQCLRRDFLLYLSVRSALYRSISLKYEGKVSQQKEEHGKCVAYFSESLRVLRNIRDLPAMNSNNNNNNKKKKKNKKGGGGGASMTLVVMQRSVAKQKQAVSKLCTDAKNENNSVYFDVVPAISELALPDSKFVIKVAQYTPAFENL